MVSRVVIVQPLRGQREPAFHTGNEHGPEHLAQIDRSRRRCAGCRRGAASSSVISALPAKFATIGPSLTVIESAKVLPMGAAVSAAPGRQRTMASMSWKQLQT